MTPTAEHEPLEAAEVLTGPVVGLAGLAVRLTASDAPRAEAVAALFRNAERTAVHPRCGLAFTENDVDVPATEPAAVIDDLELWQPQPAHLHLRSSGGLTARASPDEIVVGGDALSLSREFRFVCSVALTHLLAQHGRHVLHGGAVVADGRVLLVLGDTGTGKSTLVFSALRLGWPALADDLVAVYQRDGTVYAVGLPRPISVPADVFVDGIPGTRPVPEDPRNRTELPGPMRTRGVHPIGAVVVTSRGSEPETAIEPIAGQDTLRIVLRASVSLADPAVLPEVFAVAGTLARLPAWSLRHGSEATSRLEAAARRLEEIGGLLGGRSWP